MIKITSAPNGVFMEGLGCGMFIEETHFNSVIEYLIEYQKEKGVKVQWQKKGTTPEKK
jgi:hypothetical protein